MASAKAADISAGTPYKLEKNTPTLFHPLKIRSITLRNRICVSPMCMYSTASSGPLTGAMTSLYITTIGHNVFNGAALAMIEATGIQPNGRITPRCPGLWNDTQQQALQNVADFLHSQGGLCGVQLSHAGRKASTQPPLIAQEFGKSSVRAGSEDGGWPDDVVAPSGGEEFSFDGKGMDPSGGYHVPKALSQAEIGEIITNYASSAKRAVDAHVDVIEIHAAHGYLVNQFLSPISNRRTDQYGGSFENRTRLLKEIIVAVRGVIPSTMPVFVRLSAEDWMSHTEIGQRLGTWDEESAIQLAKTLPHLGVDLVDITSGGNFYEAEFNVFDGGERHKPIASRVKRALLAGNVPLLVATVGLITQSKQAEYLVSGGPTGGAGVDAIFIGRQFLKEPNWVLRAADELGVDIAWPAQLRRLQPSRGARI